LVGQILLRMERREEGREAETEGQGRGRGREGGRGRGRMERGGTEGGGGGKECMGRMEAIGRWGLHVAMQERDGGSLEGGGDGG
jgi:hypothetical protein